MSVPITDIENQPKVNYYELTFLGVYCCSVVVVLFGGRYWISALFRPRGWLRLKPVKLMTGKPVATTNLSNPSPRIIFRKTRLENLFCPTLELLCPSNDNTSPRTPCTIAVADPAR